MLLALDSQQRQQCPLYQISGCLVRVPALRNPSPAFTMSKTTVCSTKLTKLTKLTKSTKLTKLTIRSSTKLTPRQTPPRVQTRFQTPPHPHHVKVLLPRVL